MKKLMLLLPILMFVACDTPYVKPKAPPIAQGKCLVDRYVGTTELTQSCNYVGYSWSCSYNSALDLDDCHRVGEAATERLPVIK